MSNFTASELADRHSKQKQARRLRRQLIRFLARRGGDLFVTLAFNCGAMALDDMRDALSDFFRRMDRKLLGSEFHKKKAEKRLRGWFFAEKTDCNAHWHGLLRLPASVADCVAMERVIHLMERYWKRCAHKGDLVALSIRSHKRRVCRYIIKEQRGRDLLGKMALAEEFHPR